MGLLCAYCVRPVFARVGNDPAERTLSAAVSEVASNAGTAADCVCSVAGRSWRFVDVVLCGNRCGCRHRVRCIGGRNGFDRDVRLAIHCQTALHGASTLDVAMLFATVFGGCVETNSRAGDGDRSRRRMAVSDGRLDELAGSVGGVRSGSMAEASTHAAKVHCSKAMADSRLLWLAYFLQMKVDAFFLFATCRRQRNEHFRPLEGFAVRQSVQVGTSH